MIYIKTNTLIKSLISLGTCWCLLGFKRSLNLYDYNYNKINSYSNKKEPYMYSTKFANGLLGVFVYVNPLLLVITIPKEIYRLEVKFRGLEDEKKTSYYNQLF